MGSEIEITDLKSLTRAVDRGKALYKDGDYGGAAEIFVACVTVAPQDAVLWSHLASTLRRQKKLAACLSAHRRALELDPDNVMMRKHFANALCDAGQFDEAGVVRQKLFDESGGDAETTGMMAEVLHCTRRQAEAVALIDAAETRYALPDKLRLQRSIANLAQGHWAAGFAEFDARRAMKPFVTDDKIRWTEWRGEDLAGKSLLVLNEQGFGDAIFSARFMEALKARGALVTMVTSTPLLRLFSNLDNVDVARRRVDKHDRFDLYTYAMSIPDRLGFDDAALPPPVQFHIPAESRDRAARIIFPFRDRFRIGMVWTGSTLNPINGARATTPERFLPLADLPGVQFFSLYKGDEIGALRQSGAEGLIVNACQSDADFADTAGVVEAMDLVVTTDTAVAHLAGSLGKPTWLLLSRQGFWYWGYGETSPWYPSVRLYHQSEQGQWDDVFARVTEDLRALLGTTPAPAAPAPADAPTPANS